MKSETGSFLPDTLLRGRGERRPCQVSATDFLLASMKLVLHSSGVQECNFSGFAQRIDLCTVVESMSPLWVGGRGGLPILPFC